MIKSGETGQAGGRVQIMNGKKAVGEDQPERLTGLLSTPSRITSDNGVADTYLIIG